MKKLPEAIGFRQFVFYALNILAERDLDDLCHLDQRVLDLG